MRVAFSSRFTKALLVAATMLGLAAPGAALSAPTVIDFEALAASTTAYSVSGVTFTSGVGGFVNPVDGPNGTRTIIGNYAENDADPGNGTFDPLKAVFGSLMGTIKVDLGDYPLGDEDLLFLEAFDAGDVSLGRIELLIGADEPSFQTLTIKAAGIKSVNFGSIGGGGSSVYADNFSFDTAVPEPSTWTLMILGFASAGAAMRRRRATMA